MQCSQAIQCTFVPFDSVPERSSNRWYLKNNHIRMERKFVVLPSNEMFIRIWFGLYIVTVDSLLTFEEAFHWGKISRNILICKEFLTSTVPQAALCVVTTHRPAIL